MSCLTENTIVIKSSDIDNLNTLFKIHQKEYGSYIKNPVEVFKNNELAIFVFDCNGQPLGIEENLEWLILETNFLDGDGYYTQRYNSNLDFCEEVETPAKELIKSMLNEEEYENIKNKLLYSDEILHETSIQQNLFSEDKNTDKNTYVLIRFNNKTNNIDYCIEGKNKKFLDSWAFAHTTKTKNSILFEKETGNILFYYKGSLDRPEIIESTGNIIDYYPKLHRELNAGPFINVLKQDSLGKHLSLDKTLKNAKKQQIQPSKSISKKNNIELEF